MELISVKDYCKIANITDAGARKRVALKQVKSVILDEMLYIVNESDEKKETIKTLRNRLRNATDKIKLLTAEKQTIIDQREHIAKLEGKILTLESKLEAVQIKKDSLYEKVIGHLTLIQLPNTETSVI